MKAAFLFLSLCFTCLDLPMVISPLASDTLPKFTHAPDRDAFLFLSLCFTQSALWQRSLQNNSGLTSCWSSRKSAWRGASLVMLLLVAKLKLANDEQDQLSTRTYQQNSSALGKQPLQKGTNSSCEAFNSSHQLTTQPAQLFSPPIQWPNPMFPFS